MKSLIEEIGDVSDINAILEISKKVTSEKRSCGKRGASMKLKRLLDGEKNESIAKIPKKPAADSNKKTPKPAKNKPINPKILKKTEIDAYKDVLNQTEEQATSSPIIPTIDIDLEKMEKLSFGDPQMKPQDKSEADPQMKSQAKSTATNQDKTYISIIQQSIAETSDLHQNKTEISACTTSDSSKQHEKQLAPTRLRLDGLIPVAAQLQTQSTIRVPYLDQSVVSDMDKLSSTSMAVGAGLNVLNESEFDQYSFSGAMADAPKPPQYENLGEPDIPVQFNKRPFPDLAPRMSPSTSLAPKFTSTPSSGTQKQLNENMNNTFSTPPARTASSCYSSDSQTVSGPSSMEQLMNSFTSQEQTTILRYIGLLNVLSNSVCNGTQIPAQMIATTHQIIDERKVPLIIDPQNKEKYAHFKVNAAKLRGFENKCPKVPFPANYLMNNVSGMLFTTEELANAKGVSNLNPLKVEALSEYLFSKCTQLNLAQIDIQKSKTMLQNKITNARAAMKKSAK